MIRFYPWSDKADDKLSTHSTGAFNPRPRLTIRKLSSRAYVDQLKPTTSHGDVRGQSDRYGPRGFHVNVELQTHKLETLGYYRHVAGQQLARLVFF